MTGVQTCALPIWQDDPAPAPAAPAPLPVAVALPDDDLGGLTRAVSARQGRNGAFISAPSSIPWRSPRLAPDRHIVPLLVYMLLMLAFGIGAYWFYMHPYVEICDDQGNVLYEGRPSRDEAPAIRQRVLHDAGGGTGTR